MPPVRSRWRACSLSPVRKQKTSQPRNDARHRRLHCAQKSAASLPPVTRLTFRYDRVGKRGMSTCCSSSPDAALRLSAPCALPKVPRQGSTPALIGRPRPAPESPKEITPHSHSSHLNKNVNVFTKIVEASGSKEIRLPRGASISSTFPADSRRPFACLFANQRELNRDDQPT